MNATDTVCNSPHRDEGYVPVTCATVLGTSALLAVLDDDIYLLTYLRSVSDRTD